MAVLLHKFTIQVSVEFTDSKSMAYETLIASDNVVRFRHAAVRSMMGGKRKHNLAALHKQKAPADIVSDTRRQSQADITTAVTAGRYM